MSGLQSIAVAVDAGVVGSSDADCDRSPTQSYSDTFSPPGSTDSVPGAAAEVAEGGSPGSDSEFPALCDCPCACTHVAVGDVSRCESCRWTQFDPCPCVCPGCLPPGDVHLRCVLPGCFDYGFYDLLTCHRERCCGPFHEQMLARLELCPSVMPGGYLTSISVFGPAHDPPGLPVKLLVSPGMSVEALVDYISMVFFGHNPNDEDIFGDPGDVPRRWQVRLMPGADVVSNASSTLLFPFPPGSVLCPRPPSRVASEVGIKFRSVLQVSRLFDSGGTSVDPFLATSAALVDTAARSLLVSSADSIISSLAADGVLAVDRFSARLEAWRRNVPLFSSMPSATFDPAFGASIGAVISAQLAGVRAALSADRAALSGEVRS